MNLLTDNSHLLYTYESYGPQADFADLRPAFADPKNEGGGIF